MECNCCGKPVTPVCLSESVYCSPGCYEEHAATVAAKVGEIDATQVDAPRLGGRLSGKTNFASRLESFVSALVEVRDATKDMTGKLPLESSQTTAEVIGKRYIRTGNAYLALRPSAVAIAKMMNDVRMPGKLRGSKTGGAELQAVIDENLLKNWAKVIIQPAPTVSADFFQGMASAIAPFLNGDSRVASPGCYEEHAATVAAKVGEIDATQVDAPRLGGRLSGKTNFASRLESFVSALVEVRDATKDMTGKLPLESSQTTAEVIGKRYIRTGNAYLALRPSAVAIAKMMNDVRMPGKLRGSKTGGAELQAVIDENLLKNWAKVIIQPAPTVSADFFQGMASAIAPFLNGDSRVAAVFQDISRELSFYVSSRDTSPAVLDRNLKTMRDKVKKSGAVLDEIYDELIKSLKESDKKSKEQMQ